MSAYFVQTERVAVNREVLLKTRMSLTLLALAVNMALHQPITAQPTVARTVFGNGATKADDGVFQVVGTLAQPTIGTLSGIDHQTRIGFWVARAKTAESETEDLISEIEDLNLPAGTENSLTSKLNNALTKLEQGNPNAAINQLNGFINQVNAQAGKKISQSDADALIAQAQAIINAVESGGSAKALAAWRDGNSPFPDGYGIDQSYPNPANPVAVITFRLPEPGEVSVAVYNALGQRIKLLAEDAFGAGVYRLTWDGKDDQSRNVSSGVYLYRFASEGLVETRKLVLVR